MASQRITLPFHAAAQLLNALPPLYADPPRVATPLHHISEQFSAAPFLTNAKHNLALQCFPAAIPDVAAPLHTQPLLISGLPFLAFASRG